MKTEQILELLSVEDLSPDLQLIAESEGMDAVKSLIKVWDGTRIQVPKLNRITPLLRKYIKARISENPEITARMLAKEVNRKVDFVFKLMKEVKEY